MSSKTKREVAVVTVISLLTVLLTLLPEPPKVWSAPVSQEMTFLDVAAGNDRAVAIGNNGYLYAWGQGVFYGVGDGTTQNRTSPVQVSTQSTGLATFSAVSAGSGFTLALSSDGKIYSWGRNDKGQLGDGTTQDRLTPVEVSTSLSFVAISAGDHHSIAITENGQLFSWGGNSKGQVGISNNSDVLLPTAVSTASSGTRTFSSIAAGQQHTLALAFDGTLFAWGRNYYGQLGDGTTTDSNGPVLVDTSLVSGVTWVSIEAGMERSAALGDDGRIYSWGANNYGQLGIGSTSSGVTTPTSASSNASFIGVQVSKHTVGLKSDGSAESWGYNTYGQVGDGTTTNRVAPADVDLSGLGGVTVSKIAVGPGNEANFTLALGSNGRIYSWGRNNYGQLGIGSTTNAATPTLMSFEVIIDDGTSPTTPSNNANAPEAAVIVPAPAPYSGPLVTSPRTVVYRGEIVVLEGSKLDQVSQAFILNVEIGILDATSKSITLSISNSIALGSQDLIFLSGHGKLTVMDAVYVRERAEVEPESGALIGWSWIPKFSGNSRSLDIGQINSLATLSERFDEATTVICWGYTTALEPNQWAIDHAQKRAQAACEEILRRSPNIDTATRIRFGASKLAAMRTAVQFWGSNSG